MDAILISADPVNVGDAIKHLGNHKELYWSDCLTEEWRTEFKEREIGFVTYKTRGKLQAENRGVLRDCRLAGLDPKAQTPPEAGPYRSPRRRSRPTGRNSATRASPPRDKNRSLF